MVSLARTVPEWGDQMAARIVGYKSSARRIAKGLTLRYPAEHPGAGVASYATSDGVRLRVVDPAFERQGLRERQSIILPHLIDLPKDVVDGIRVSLLITPAEQAMSMLSLEFDEASRSPL